MLYTGICVVYLHTFLYLIIIIGKLQIIRRFIYTRIRKDFTLNVRPFYLFKKKTYYFHEMLKLFQYITQFETKIITICFMGRIRITLNHKFCCFLNNNARGKICSWQLLLCCLIQLRFLAEWSMCCCSFMLFN